MNHLYKGKAKNILAWLTAAVFVFLTSYGSAFDTNDFLFHTNLTADTIPVKRLDSILLKNPKDSSLQLSDSGSNVIPEFSQPGIMEIKDTTTDINSPMAYVDTLTFKSSKDSLDAPIAYHADDSMVFDVPSKKLLLYGKTANVKYQTSELGAPLIEYNQSTNLIKAILQKDSTGKVIAYPTYIDKDFKSISDTLELNMKTGKGLTKGTYTQQGELFVYGEKIKKVDDDVFYALRGRFTTCNLDTPHFAFVSSKIKFINKKMAFSGPVHPEFEGVPLPIVLPFGIYPLSQGRHSGLIAPSFTANDQYGLALENLGYYKILSQTWDAVARGTIYSYGGWAASLSPRYFKKYRYQGNFNINVLSTKVGFKGDPDYQVAKSTNIQWSHTADTKARPGVTFSASVNAGSSKYNENLPNNPQANFSNQLNSTIAYGKVWKNKPFSIQVAANHNQNTVQRLININFPDLNFNVNTLYPFRKKEVVGSYKWYENIGIALNTNVRGTSFFYDTLGAGFAQLSKNYKWGASHNVPITLSLPSLGPLQVSPSVSYQERWFQEKLVYRWDDVAERLDTISTKGFYTSRDMSFALNVSTRVFGSYLFRKGSKVQAIRHEVRPTLSASFKPDFNSQNFYNVQVDTFGNKVQRSFYERAIFTGFSGQRFAGLNFAIDNNIQMKVRNRKDTAEGAVKKITLIDGLSLGGSYNFLEDSFKLSTLSLSARSNLFEKVNITANASFDPYLTNEFGRRVDKLVWTKKVASLGTLTNAGISLSSQFKGGDKTAPTNGGLVNNNLNNRQNINTGGLPLDEYQQEAMYMQNNPGQFADFSIPWSVDFSYSLRYSQSRVLTKGFYVLQKSLSQDVNFNNSVNLTPKWKIGLQGSYNITKKELGVLSMYLSRDLHCWQMSINLAPVGRFRFFTINISPKSPLLRDIKVNRTRYFYDQ